LCLHVHAPVQLQLAVVPHHPQHPAVVLLLLGLLCLPLFLYVWCGVTPFLYLIFVFCHRGRTVPQPGGAHDKLQAPVHPAQRRSVHHHHLPVRAGRDHLPLLR